MFPNSIICRKQRYKFAYGFLIDTYNNIVKAGYDSPIVAVIRGFDLLIREAEDRQNSRRSSHTDSKL